MNNPLDISIQDGVLVVGKAANAMVQAVIHYLTKVGETYDIDVDGERTLIRIGASSLDNIMVKTVFDIEESRDRFGIFVYAPLPIPESRRAEIMAYLTRANRRVYLSKFEFDMVDGILRVVSTARTEGSTLSVQMLKRMLGDAYSVMDTYIPGVLGIVYGNQTADQAWEVFTTGIGTIRAEEIGI